MKTKTFFILCLFLGIGLTKLSAQPDNKNGTGSVAYDYPDLGWISPVVCGGKQIDLIEGVGDAHVIDHYTNGIQDWEILMFSGTGTSLWTNEAITFTFKEQDKTWIPKPPYLYVNTHIKGDKGALYDLLIVWNTNDWSYDIKSATCTGNTK